MVLNFALFQANCDTMRTAQLQTLQSLIAGKSDVEGAYALGFS
jgi:hypothetical protein